MNPLTPAPTTILNPTESDDFQAIVRAIQKKEIVLFLGAGIHFNSPNPPNPNVPYVYSAINRPRLASEFSASLVNDGQNGGNNYYTRIKETDFPAWANFTKVTMDYELFIEEDRNPALNRDGEPLKAKDAKTRRQQGRNRLSNKVKLAVQENTQTSPLIGLLVRLGFPVIVTTNYDGHYESAALNLGHNPVVRWYHPRKSQSDLEYFQGQEPSQENPFIFKIHGHIFDPDSLVITDDDYIDFVMKMAIGGDHAPIPRTIASKMSLWPTLYLGYSLADYDLRLLLKILHFNKDTANRDTANRDTRSLSVSKTTDPHIRRVWQDEKGSISFQAEDIWSFIPRLYETVMNARLPAAPLTLP